MKTYLITETNEPLKEGCLTNRGVVAKHGSGTKVDTRTFYTKKDLKHLKCIEQIPDKEITDLLYSEHEITDPKELQKVFEEIKRNQRGFTLEPGVYEVDDNCEHQYPKD